MSRLFSSYCKISDLFASSRIIRNFEANNHNMEKAAEYIKRFEITSLWNGQKHIVWDLKPDVNILSGIIRPAGKQYLRRILQLL